jgi:transketolase
MKAAGLAGHLKLGRLIVLWDDNRITIDGSTDLSRNEDVMARHAAMGWHTVECDGMDSAKVSKALDEAVRRYAPVAGPLQDHHRLWRTDQAGHFRDPRRGARRRGNCACPEGIGLVDEAFVIPDDVAKGWRDAGARNAKTRAEWHRRLDASASKADFLARMDGKLGDEWLKPYIDALLADPPKVATRKASEMALEVITTAVAATIGGSADLTGSNNTKTKALQPLDSTNYGGRYIYYGIREFGMAAAMNGMALHGGIVPFGGTFLVFSDYCRNAIRLSALQSARVIYVMTHDSIGLGEDGPTHQPIEHLSRCG